MGITCKASGIATRPSWEVWPWRWKGRENLKMSLLGAEKGNKEKEGAH